MTLAIERVSVKPDRVSVLVRCSESMRYSTPSFARYLARLFPSLPEHACVNDEGIVFGAVISSTSVPHVFEHVVIQLQAAASHPPKRFVGVTSWVRESEGLARVEVSYADDLVALRALSEAADIINAFETASDEQSS